VKLPFWQLQFFYSLPNVTRDANALKKTHTKSKQLINHLITPLCYNCGKE
jgi:hypothetical protein